MYINSFSTPEKKKRKIKPKFFQLLSLNFSQFFTKIFIFIRQVRQVSALVEPPSPNANIVLYLIWNVSVEFQVVGETQFLT